MLFPYKYDFILNNKDQFIRLINKMEFIKTKTILSKVKYGNEWYGIDYNMNLYRGCSHKDTRYYNKL